MRKNNTVEITFYILVVVNLLFVLIPYSQDSSFFISSPSEEFKQMNLKYLLLINLVLYGIAIFWSGIDLNNTQVRLIMLISALYIMVNWYQGTLANYFSLVALPCSYLALFYIFPKYEFSRKILLFVYLLLLTWSLYPLLYSLILPGSMQAFNYQDMAGLNTFRGFGSHRNVYGFYTGLTLILTLSVHKNISRHFKIPIMILLSVGLLLSESRSSIVAAFISTLYFYYTSASRKGLYIFKASVLTTGLFIFINVYILPNSTRGIAEIFNISGRIFLNSELLARNSSNLIFGSGVGTLLTNTTINDVSAHNFVVQTILDYGIFIAGVFFIIIFQAWKSAGILAQTSLLFLILVGLAQPYFSFGVPSYFTLMTILIGISADQIPGNAS